MILSKLISKFPARYFLFPTTCKPSSRNRKWYFISVGDQNGTVWYWTINCFWDDLVIFRIWKKFATGFIIIISIIQSLVQSFALKVSITLSMDPWTANFSLVMTKNYLRSTTINNRTVSLNINMRYGIWWWSWFCNKVMPSWKFWPVMEILNFWWKFLFLTLKTDFHHEIIDDGSPYGRTLG